MLIDLCQLRRDPRRFRYNLILSQEAVKFNIHLQRQTAIVNRNPDLSRPHLNIPPTGRGLAPLKIWGIYEVLVE